MSLYDQDDPPGGGTTVHRDVYAEESQRRAEADPLAWREDDQVARVTPTWWRIGRALLAVAAVVWIAMQAYDRGRAWFDAQLDPPGPPGEAVEFVVPSGATTAAIGQLLEDLDVVPNSTFFRYYARYQGEENFQAGEYTMFLNSSAQEAIDVLNAGPKPQVFSRFQVREGLWLDEMLDTMADQLEGVEIDDLELALRSGRVSPRYRPADTTSWEGLLFPDTYEVNADATAAEVLQKMADEFTRVTGELGYGAAENFVGRSAYEVVIIASLIEAETRVAEERPLVASVIYNRLREGIPLGIDATCLYGAGIRVVDDAINAGAFDPDSESPYSCRGPRQGLPPTPINSPSRASLEAAIAPEETEFLYYVLTEADGSHTFAETAEEFEAARQVCIERGLGCG